MPPSEIERAQPLHASHAKMQSARARTARPPAPQQTRPCLARTWRPRNEIEAAVSCTHASKTSLGLGA